MGGIDTGWEFQPKEIGGTNLPLPIQTITKAIDTDKIEVRIKKQKSAAQEVKWIKKITWLKSIPRAGSCKQPRWVGIF